MKTCAWCGREFKPMPGLSLVQKECSKKCREESRNSSRGKQENHKPIKPIVFTEKEKRELAAIKKKEEKERPKLIKEARKLKLHFLFHEDGSPKSEWSNTEIKEEIKEEKEKIRNKEEKKEEKKKELEKLEKEAAERSGLTLEEYRARRDKHLVIILVFVVIIISILLFKGC